nr:MAG TPA_asm: hypothetical protein [Caudoviricetes sp.]DAN90743.1 MAG TPA: hypothetical protein [Bacteriophage sp.]DAU01309.1 MAG TPA: hypothetical protein [Caudoviricetes sp.]DAV95167.1 MAG TPA: hypothetical protein [Caudoviricetes sp.]DAX09887.1 MAG TPA: hypothetical protein [Bacteriophage sp.]
MISSEVTLFIYNTFKVSLLLSSHVVRAFFILRRVCG